MISFVGALSEEKLYACSVKCGNLEYPPYGDNSDGYKSYSECTTGCHGEDSRPITRGQTSQPAPEELELLQYQKELLAQAKQIAQQVQPSGAPAIAQRAIGETFEKPASTSFVELLDEGDKFVLKLGKRRFSIRIPKAVTSVRGLGMLIINTVDLGSRMREIVKEGFTPVSEKV